MKCSKQSCAVVSLLFAALAPLSVGTLEARDTDAGSLTLAAVHTTKQRCLNACRARYRGCVI